MACILTRDSTSLFLSYAPGTGSTSLEQHLRTNHDYLKYIGFSMLHYPEEAFGVNSDISRHCTYKVYLRGTGSPCDYIAACVRNPFEYYFSEYNRIITKWSRLLDDPGSWIYRQDARSTFDLVLDAKRAGCFDRWLYRILEMAVQKGYIIINEDHMDGATHHLRTEDLSGSFDLIGSELFSVRFSDIIGPLPHVNVTDYSGHYSRHLSDKTKLLALDLFGYYLDKFSYRFEDRS